MYKSADLEKKKEFDRLKENLLNCRVQDDITSQVIFGIPRLNGLRPG
jgi:hypothetical protein